MKISAIAVLLLALPFVLAAGESMSDSCYAAVAVEDDLTDLTLSSSCQGGNSIEWTNVNMTVLGAVLDGEVAIGRDWMYVDSAQRPDLDAPAVLTFRALPFAVEPDILVDGSSCLAPSCNSTFRPAVGELVVVVGGFSNYSLEAKQDFTVYSDPAPELKGKVYQTVDLGDARRADDYACIVQIFGQSAETAGQWVLVQTNPKREVQAKIMGNPDTNQPESLGYFPSVKGMVNVYFRGDELAGYNEFEYVVYCSSNSTRLVYEEAISTRYAPVGRTAVGRGIWLTQGTNAIFIIIGLIVAVIMLLLARKAYKAWS